MNAMDLLAFGAGALFVALAFTLSTWLANRRDRRPVRNEACQSPVIHEPDYLQALQVQRRKAQREYARLLGDGFLALAERQLACVYKLDEEIRKHS